MDTYLNKAARTYCHYLHTNTLWEHSKNTSYGESIYWFYSNIGISIANLGSQATKSWYDEIVNYNFMNGRSTNGKEIGHFTQLVWNSTILMGMGYAMNDDGTEAFVCAN